MKPSSYKRILAYLIDVFIVSFFGVLLGYFIPVSDEYKTANEELASVISDYEEEKIDKNAYLEKANELSYTINKESLTMTVITIVIYIIYFVVVPYYYNGQTLGKKIMKLKVISNKDKKLSMNNYLIRALIVDSILSNVIGVVAILLLSKSAYLTTYNFVSNFFMYLNIITFAMILFSKDGRGLHDILAGTKVVVIDSDGNIVPEAQVINEVKEEQPKIETEVKKETKEEKRKETKKEEKETVPEKPKEKNIKTKKTETNDSDAKTKPVSKKKNSSKQTKN